MKNNIPGAKGVAFKELLQWFDQRLGRDKLVEAIASLSPEYRDIIRLEIFNFGILASSWYPFPFVHQLIDALTRSMSRQEKFDLAQDAGKAVMEITMRGIYRALVRAFVSPALYAKFSSRLWQSYYDSGDFKIILSEDGSTADCTVRNWEGHHPFVCDMNIAAATAIYEAMGQQEVKTDRVACIDKGDSLCRFITTWKK